jgi:hypothetical protein
MSLSTASVNRMSGLASEAKMGFFGRRTDAARIETTLNTERHRPRAADHGPDRETGEIAARVCDLAAQR